MNGDIKDRTSQCVTPVKVEVADAPKPFIKPEKMDYDSSATASADEDHHFLDNSSMDEKSNNPLSKVWY